MATLDNEQAPKGALISDLIILQQYVSYLWILLAAYILHNGFIPHMWISLIDTQNVTSFRYFYVSVSENKLSNGLVKRTNSFHYKIHFHFEKPISIYTLFDDLIWNTLKEISLLCHIHSYYRVTISSFPLWKQTKICTGYALITYRIQCKAIDSPTNGKNHHGGRSVKSIACSHHLTPRLQGILKCGWWLSFYFPARQKNPSWGLIKLIQIWKYLI